MATNLDKPKHLETWVGHAHGLRLRRHPSLAKALPHLAEFPMVMRGGRVMEGSSLRADATPQIRVETLPVFRQSSVGLTVELRVEIDYPCGGDNRRFGWLRLRTDDTELHEYLVLHPGQRQVVTFPFPHFERAVRMRVELEIRDEGTVTTEVELQPEKQWTWYVAFQTHLDLGWTDRAANVIEALRQMTSEDAVRICRQFADNPPGQRFIWTCECSEALRYAWEGCDAARRRELLGCIEQGLIQSCVLPFSFHTSIMSRDLMQRAIQRSFALRREIGAEQTLDLSVAQQNDVPGHSWVLPDLLAEAGVHRAMIGHNWMIRGCRLPPLFRWRGPDGGEVLTLATTCADFGGPSGLPQVPEELRALSRNSPVGTQREGTALFRAVTYGENCGPAFAAQEIAAIQRWQEQFVWPKLVVGGPKDFFQHVERETDIRALPVVDQEISDWWVDGPASMPIAMGQFRRAMAVLPVLKTAPRVEENLILFAEHTFGLNAQLVKVKAAAQDWRIDRGLEEYVATWEDKEAYARAAWEEVQKLHRPPARQSSPGQTLSPWRIEWDAQGITRVADPDGRVWVDCCQTTAWPRLGTVVQRLLPLDVGSWWHHNPPAAPHAGERGSRVLKVEVAGAGVAQRVTVIQQLETPAGAIPVIRFTLSMIPGTDCLHGELLLQGKEATAQSELLALAWPLAVRAPRYAGEDGGRLLRVDDDQLPDANRDAHSFGWGWIAGEGDADQQLAVSSPDAFLWHYGGLRYCNFNRQPVPRTGEVYAHLFNNVWETNFRGWIGGDLRYEFFLRPVRRAHALEALQEMTGFW